MSTPSDPRTLVMHGLRLKGFAEAPAVAEAVGITEIEAKPVLDELVVQQLATYRDGRISGFTLTPDGRAEHAGLLAAELDAVGARDAVHTTYRRFLSFNTELLTVCTAWQLRDVAGESTPNDHSDAAYDADVIEDLFLSDDDVVALHELGHRGTISAAAVGGGVGCVGLAWRSGTV